MTRTRPTARCVCCPARIVWAACPQRKFRNTAPVSPTFDLARSSAGDALLMRPLLLHASGRSTSPRHRRVLHIEYAAFALPQGLHWHEAA